MIDETPKRELTYGEKMVGINFNPSNRADVEECKATFAKAIDQLAAIEHGVEFRSFTSDFATLAITKCVEAQMMAVKALTFQY